MSHKVLVLQTGDVYNEMAKKKQEFGFPGRNGKEITSKFYSTIDKCYPKTILGYAFEIGEPAVSHVLDRVKSTLSVEVKSVCRLDSQDIRHEDRVKLARTCRETDVTRILVTHGTDTMIDTAAMLSKEQLDKIIILTGSFLPETFKDSDADFNIGFALGCLQTMTSIGVFIAMNGRILPWSNCRRDPQTHLFGPVE